MPSTATTVLDLLKGVTNTDGSALTTTGPASQPVSGTVSVSGSVTVTGPLTDTQIRASALPISAAALPLPSGAATESTLAAINTKTPALGAAAKASSVPVNIASDQTVQVSTVNAATSALTNVGSSASSVTVLALNTARRAATIYNDSAANLYLKLGATASTTSFTVKMPPQSLYELPQPCYSGIIDGIWDSANGSARVTEIT